MIKRSHRFHGRQSLRFVYQRGETKNSPLLSVKSILNQRRKTYRCAVVVSKKVHKSAVVRNRIRRRIYEAVRNLESSIVSPQDIVITVNSEEVANISAGKLHNALQEILSRAGVTERTENSHDIINPKET